MFALLIRDGPRLGDLSGAQEEEVLLLMEHITWKECIEWLMTPYRMMVIFCARLLHMIFGPLLKLVCVIIIKRLYVGTFKPGPLPRGALAREWELNRRWLMSQLLPVRQCRLTPG